MADTQTEEQVSTEVADEAAEVTDAADLTDEEIESAMSEALQGGDEAVQTDDAAPEEGAPETDAEATDDKGAAADEGDSEAKTPPQWNEQIQKQNREFGNLRREFAELKGMLAQRIADAPVKTEAQREAKQEQVDLLANLHDDDSVDVGTVRKLVQQLKSTDDGEMRQKIERLEAEQAELRREKAFNTRFKNLVGQHERLSNKAYKLAQDNLGENADPAQLDAFADAYLVQMAKVLDDRAGNGKPRPKPKPTAPGTQQETSTVDQTARMKPAESTKGATTAKTGAAPAGKEVSELSDDELEQVIAQQLQEEPSL